MMPSTLWLPRIQKGGSLNFTQLAFETSLAPVILDTDRLYANQQELLFSAASTAGIRTPNASLAAAEIQKAKFSLTAQSRAPETNLFNLPRIACWPIHADLAGNASSPYASAFDRLIAFCATINKRAVLFPAQG